MLPRRLLYIFPRKWSCPLFIELHSHFSSSIWSYWLVSCSWPTFAGYSQTCPLTTWFCSLDLSSILFPLYWLHCFLHCRSNKSVNHQFFICLNYSLDRRRLTISLSAQEYLSFALLLLLSCTFKLLEVNITSTHHFDALMFISFPQLVPEQIDRSTSPWRRKY